MNTIEFDFKTKKESSVKKIDEIKNRIEKSTDLKLNWNEIPKTKKVVRKIKGDLYKWNWMSLFFNF
jgi:hypothetical protein